MANISSIEGIGPCYATKLAEVGISTTERLLEHGAQPTARKELAEHTGISGSQLLEWINRADLFRINGIGEEYSDLLEAAGVDTVPELAQRNATNPARRMEEVNGEKQLVRRTPSSTVVGKWVSQAKDLPRVVQY